MTATEELRRMLDERGVEWEDASPVPSMKPWKTSFTSFTGEEVTIGAYDEPKWLMGTMVFHTPAQAIAATVGRDDRESYDAGFASGVKATLQQLYGLLHEYPTLDDIEAWADSQWEEYE